MQSPLVHVCCACERVFVSWGLLFGSQSQQAFRVVGAGLQMRERDGMWNVDRGTESCRNGPICWRNSIPSTSFPLPPPACGQEAGPRTRLLLKVAERGGGRQVHGTRQWGCLNFRGRLNSLSPLPPVIGDLAAEDGGWGKGRGRPGSEPPRHVGRCWVAPGPTFVARLWRWRRGGSMWKWGRAAAEALLPQPRPERHLTVPAALRGPGVRGDGGGDARPTAPAPREPRTKPAARGRPPRPRPGNGWEPVAVPAPIPAGGRRRLFVGSAPPSSPDGFL